MLSKFRHNSIIQTLPSQHSIHVIQISQTHTYSKGQYGSKSLIMVKLYCLTWPHNQPEFPNNQHEEHDSSSDLKSNDLGIKLDQPDSCGSIECLPCIKHTHSTVTSEDLRLGLSTEGAVEWNNGLVLLWEHRSLHTLEGHVCGDDDEDDRGNSSKSDHQELETGEFLLALIALAVHGIGERGEKGSRHVDSGLLGDGHDGSRNEDVLASLNGGEAAVPSLFAWVGNNDVSPGHLEAAEGNACDDGDDGTVYATECEEVGDEAVDDVVDECYVEATEGSSTSTDRLDVFECCSHL